MLDEHFTDLMIRILDAPFVSRQHCEVVREGNTFTLADLRSLNGVAINEIRVKKAVLNDKDNISVGGSHPIEVGQKRKRNQRSYSFIFERQKLENIDVYGLESQDSDEAQRGGSTKYRKAAASCVC